MSKPPPELIEAVDGERRFKLTELGNAERIAHAFGNELRYVGAWRRWLVWDKRRWRRDDLGVDIAAAKEVARALYNEAAALARAAADGDEEAAARASALVAWARSSSRANALRAAASLAQSEPPIVASADLFDRDPWAFNVENGTIDLRTGELRPHRQSDMITMLAPVTYDPAAVAPLWDVFLARIIPDPEVRGWLQRFVGHALTGDVGEQILTFLHGGGANGKSTFLGAIQHVLGDFGFQGPPGLLIAPERGGDELGRRLRASLLGKRLVVVQEVEAGRFLNEASVKQITGGDKITAARLYEADMEFSPTHKMIIAANHRPVIRGQDHAIWRRIRLVPFTVTIAKEERDPDLAAKLRAEAPGILAWAVRGCLEWRREGLGAPAAVVAATDSYKADEDRLGEFLETSTEPGECVALGDLHNVYRVWCATRNEHPWSAKAFGDALEERGLRRDRRTVGGKTARVIVGLQTRRLTR